jgi:hypothetical protein
VLLSPILVRPVREQLEHDRVIRLLQAKYKRKFDVGINPGSEQGVPVGTGPAAWYPDLVLHSSERSRKLLGVVEVETAESVNHLEAMAQWGNFARLAPFHLYVPAAMIDVARRLCLDLRVPVTEIWAYHALGEQVRFTLVQRSGDAPAEPKVVRAAAPAAPVAPAPRASAARTSRPAPGRTVATPAARARPTRPAATRSASGQRAPRAASANGRPAAKTPAKAGAPRRAAKSAPARKPPAVASKAAKRR